MRAIAESGRAPDLPTRLQLLNDHFTYALFQNVCRCVRGRAATSADAALHCTCPFCMRFALQHPVRHAAPAASTCSLPSCFTALSPAPTTLQLSRSLFEKDKLLFAFTLALKLKQDAGLVAPQELRHLMTGACCSLCNRHSSRGMRCRSELCTRVQLLRRFGSTFMCLLLLLLRLHHGAGGVAVGDLPQPNPAPDWVSNKAWGELCRASQLGPDWQGLATHVAGAWRAHAQSMHVTAELASLAKCMWPWPLLLCCPPRC